MRLKAKIRLLIVVSIMLIGIYLFIHLGSNWDYVLPRRGLKVLAIIITGGAIAFATLLFQTITHNRILTPNIMGLDSLYLMIHTIIIFLLGSSTVAITNQYLNFMLCILLMVSFSLVLYRIFFQQENRNIYFLLLMGIIMGTLFGSISTFMQVLIDPNEFQMIQDQMFASFNNVNTDLVSLSLILMLLVIGYFTRFYRYLDVLSLGRDPAINLGVSYHYLVKRLLIIVAILISIATALVGPITFLGLLVVNIAYEFFQTYRHQYLILGSILISIIALVGGQLIVEHVFSFEATLSVIINFTGGIYFIFLLLKENRSW